MRFDIIALVLMSALCARPADARDVQWDECTVYKASDNITPSDRIAACTVVLGRKLSVADRSFAYDQRCAAYDLLKRFSEALADCNAAIRLNPTGTSAYVGRGRVYSHLGDQARAREDYLQVLRLNPPVQPDPMPSTYAAVGQVTRTPYGWADLCGRQPQECQVDVLDAVDLRLTKKTWQILNSINTRVNLEIEPISNLDHWGTRLDHWDYPLDGKGDTKIYALWKRKLLMDAGFPRQALLMTIVRDLEGNGHTLLTIKSDHGDYVLDNMVAEIRVWDATGYTYMKRQSQTDPNVWVAVGPAEKPKPADSKLQRPN